LNATDAIGILRCAQNDNTVQSAIIHYKYQLFSYLKQKIPADWTGIEGLNFVHYSHILASRHVEIAILVGGLALLAVSRKRLAVSKKIANGLLLSANG